MEIEVCPICEEHEHYDEMAILAHDLYHARYVRDPERWGPSILAMRGRALEPTMTKTSTNGSAHKEDIRTRLARHAPPPGPPLIEPGGLLIRGHLTPWGGFGQCVERFGLGLADLGWTVGFEAVATDETYQALSEGMKRRLASPRSGVRTLRIEPFNCQPPRNRQRMTWLTMWESSELPAHAVEWANQHEAIVVPCAWNAENFARAGVTVPIQTVPLGVDLDLYAPHGDRADDGRVVFGGAGRTAHGGERKGLDHLARAFVDAFPDDPDVRLRLKIWPDCVVDVPDDPRIRLDRRPLSPAELAGWYRGLDVFCSASKAEGWGLQPLQAMACGRPVVACQAHGHAEFFNAACGWPVDFAWRPTSAFYQGVGQWAVPDHASLVRALRTARADDDGRRTKGLAARKRAEEFPWKAAVDRLATVLRRLDKPVVELGTPHCGPCVQAKQEAPMTLLANVGNDVWIGDKAACDSNGRAWPLAIHIGLTGKEAGSCRHFLAGTAPAGGLLVDYDENTPLTLDLIERIAAYARQPGELLIHCSAGLARSPMCALIAKIARGCEPFKAIDEINRGMWAGYHRTPQQYAHATPIILDWAKQEATP